MVAIIFTPLNSGGGGLKVYEDGFRADRGGSSLLADLSRMPEGFIPGQCWRYDLTHGEAAHPYDRSPDPAAV